MQETKTIKGITWDIIRDEDITHYRAKKEGNPHFPVMANMFTCPGFNFAFMTESGLNMSFDYAFLQRWQEKFPYNREEDGFLEMCSFIITNFLP